MLKFLIELVGWLAAALMLSAYVLLTAGRLSPRSSMYPLAERSLGSRVRDQQRLERRASLSLHQCRVGRNRNLWPHRSLATLQSLAARVTSNQGSSESPHQRS